MSRSPSALIASITGQDGACLAEILLDGGDAAHGRVVYASPALVVVDIRGHCAA